MAGRRRSKRRRSFRSIFGACCTSAHVDQDDHINGGDHQLAKTVPLSCSSHQLQNQEKDKYFDDTTGVPVQPVKQLEPIQETWTHPTKLSHSISLPPLKKENYQSTATGELDSLFGALIIFITLIVMLIWGKVCAVLCTALWLYLFPRLMQPHTTPNSYAFLTTKNISNCIVDFSSPEYKERVVFLARK